MLKIIDTRWEKVEKICYIKSQNHRITGCLRLEGTSRGHLVPPPTQAEQIAQDHVQNGFWSSPRRRLHNLSGQTGPVLCHPYSKDVLPGIQTDLFYSNFCLSPFVLTLGTTDKCLALSSLCPSFRAQRLLIDIDKRSLCFLFRMSR